MPFDTIIDRRNTGSSKWEIAPGPVDPEQCIIPLSVADMEFKSPLAIRERLKALADTGVWGYTMPRPEYYDALISWFSRRHDFDIEKEWVVPTTGVVQAVYAAVRAFSEEGDNVLVQTPVYYPFYRAIEMNQRKLLKNELLIEDGRYVIDFDDLEQKMKQAKIFILCSPHNPISRVWDRNELDKMAELAAQHDVFVISDEIHCDFSFTKKHTVFSKVARDHGVKHLLAFSASKTFSLAGLNVASIVIEDPVLRDRYAERVRTDGVNTHSTFGFAAAEAGYTECDDWYEKMLDTVYQNYRLLKDYVVENMPLVHVFDLEGTYLAWLDFRALGVDHETLEKHMVDHCLYLDEGYIFGEGGRGFERINLACPRRVIEAALGRLKAVYDDLLGE